MTTSAPFGARLDDVVVRFGKRHTVVGDGTYVTEDATTALDGASVTIRAGVITGLLGRNGAGKTTMLSLLAAFTRPTSGTVLVGPEGSEADPWENPWIASGTQLVRESGDLLNDEKVTNTLKYYADMRPNWDATTAERLLDVFEVDARKKPAALSRGKRSALGAS